MKLQAINSPFEQQWFRLSVVQRWMEQGKVVLLPDNTFRFLTDFERKDARDRIDTERFRYFTNDGIARRWTTSPSGGMDVLQLLPLKDVGTPSNVTRHPIRLHRRSPVSPAYDPRPLPVYS